MQEMPPKTDLKALARSLDELIAFADNKGSFILSATLDAARVQFADRYEGAKD